MTKVQKEVDTNEKTTVDNTLITTRKVVRNV